LAFVKVLAENQPEIISATPAAVS